MKIEPLQDKVVEKASLHIIDIDPHTDPRWESLMNRLPNSVIYQHPGWLGVLEEAYGYKPMHLACEDATGTLRGILPLVYRRGLRTGRLCFSPPPVSGPLADNEQASIMLIQAAIERSREKRAGTFQFTTRSANFDHMVEDVVGKPQYEAYELSLRERPDISRLDARVRRAVKKASKMGVQIHAAETMSELRTWYTLYLETMRRLLVVPQPYHMFEAAWRRLHSQGLLRLLLAEHDEGGQRRLVAGFLFLQNKYTISHLYTGWRREDQDLRPNDLLHWQAIQDAYAQGLIWYDFGNAPTGNQGIAQFKAKWVPETRTALSYTYPAISRSENNETTRESDHGGQSQSATDTSDQADPSKSLKRRIITPLWQRLPLKATELVSEWSRIIHYY